MHQHSAAQPPELSVGVKPLVMDRNRRQMTILAVRLAGNRRRLFLARFASAERDGAALDKLRFLGGNASRLHLALRLRLLRGAVRAPAGGQANHNQERHP